MMFLVTYVDIFQPKKLNNKKGQNNSVILQIILSCLKDSDFIQKKLSI